MPRAVSFLCVLNYFSSSFGQQVDDFFFFFFIDKVLLFSPDWPGTWYVGPAGLELRRVQPASAFFKFCFPRRTGG